jgi:hypothetical protein
MDYSGIYIELMERATDRIIDGYTEKHHIIPRCMGGDDKPRNLVLLTASEHYLAHQLLVKIYPKNNKLIFAASLMTTDKKGNRINNKIFSWLKIKALEANKSRKYSKETRAKMSESGKNRAPMSDETKSRISESTKGKKKPPFSDETKRKMSESSKKRVRAPFSNETKLKMSKAVLNRPSVSKETRQKQADSAKRAWEKRKTKEL